MLDAHTPSVKFHPYFPLNGNGVLDVFLHWEAILIQLFNLVLIALSWLIVG